MDLPEDQAWIRTDAAGVLLGVSAVQVTRWCRQGKIYALQPGGPKGMWLVNRNALEDGQQRPDEAPR